MRGLGDWPHRLESPESCGFGSPATPPAPHPASPRKRRGEVKISHHFERRARLAQSGQIAEGLTGEALEHCQRNDENWIMPELLRVKCALMERQGLANSILQAEDHYLRSLDVARGQGAVCWQLRTAMSLARPWNDSDAPEKRANCCRRFTIALPRGSRLPTCKPRRRFSVRSRDLPSAHRLGALDRKRLRRPRSRFHGCHTYGQTSGGGGPDSIASHCQIRRLPTHSR